MPPFSPSERIDRHVDGEDNEPQHDLNARSEASRVDERQEVMLDEATIVAGRPRRASKRILERRQWANGCGELRERRPRHRWKVDRCPDPAVKHEQPARQHEDDEREVSEQHRVGGQARNHWPESAVERGITGSTCGRIARMPC